MAKRGPKLDLEKRKAFAIWWSLPKAKRVPSTIGEWCEENEIVQSTTWRWRKDTDFRKMVLQYRFEIAEDSMTDIVGALKDKALDGELGHIKFIMEVLGDYLPTSQLKHQVDASSIGSNGFSADMIEYLATELVEHDDLAKYNVAEKDMRGALLEILMEE